MGQVKFSAEQIIHKLREADVELAKAPPVKAVRRQLRVTDKRALPHQPSRAPLRPSRLPGEGIDSGT